MSVLRRHRILEDDVRRVIGHLKAHKKITKNDVLHRPRLKKKKGQGPNEEIPWAHAILAGSWQQAKLKPGPNNAAVLYTKENDVWKLVVPEKQITEYLRKAMLDTDSKMPFGRDSAYHHVQRLTDQPARAVQVSGEAGRVADYQEHPKRASEGGH